VPAVVATTGADAFETIYQQFAIVWNKPWLLVCYEAMLLLIKLILVPIWAFFCIAGFLIVMLPMRLLHTETMQQFMGYANLWLGGTVEKLATLPYINNFGVFDIGTTAQMPTLTGIAAVTTPVTSIFLTITLLISAGLVIAYLFSIASAGNTVIYTIVRKKIDGQNLLVPPDAEPIETAN
jgi:hypothetical protein